MGTSDRDAPANRFDYEPWVKDLAVELTTPGGVWQGMRAGTEASRMRLGELLAFFADPNQYGRTGWWPDEAARIHSFIRERVDGFYGRTNG